MALSIIGSDAVQGEVFLPGQIFVFGGFALRANSLGHLEQIESYAPGHQVRFKNFYGVFREGTRLAMPKTICTPDSSSLKPGSGATEGVLD